jgi:hypothetical protein
MKHLPIILIASLGFALCARAGDTPKIEGVSQAAIQNAFQILRSDYIRSNELNFDELNRAALQGLLQRLYLGATLIRKSDALRPVTATGVIAEKLTAEIGYLRPQSYAEAEISELQAKLREFRTAGLPHLILDLRSAAAPGEFDIAAAMLECFIPESELIFKLKQVGRDDSQLFISHRAPIWTGPLLVLVDQETNNLGETIAAVLRQRKQAVILGTRTRGATVRYETQPLDDEWLLRFARAEMLLMDDSSLFQLGLPVDFSIDLPLDSKRQLFPSSNPPPLKQTVFDQPRPRYNEAALVARKNPELEEYIRRSAGKPSADSQQPVHDTVLQRAVDILLTRTHLDGASLPWEQKLREPSPTIRKATRAP